MHNGDKVFFAFKWTDPTRSLRRIPMIKKEDGWHVVDSRADMMDVVDFYEDKLAIIFSDKPAIGGAGVVQSRPAPLPADKPRPLQRARLPLHHRRQLSSTCGSGRPRAAACSAASTTSTSARRATRAPTRPAYKARYQGGYWNDPGRAFYSYNYKPFTKGYKGPVEVLRLPKDWKKTQDGLGKFDLDPNISDDENGSLEHNVERDRRPTPRKPTRRFRSAP